MSTQTRRLLCVALVLACALGAMVVCGRIVDAKGADGRSPASSKADCLAGFPDYYQPEGDIVMGLFEKMSGTHESAVAAPGFFIDEVLDPNMLGALQVYCSDNFVGLVCPASAASLKESVAKELGDRHWVHVGATSASEVYLKDRGSCRWLSIAFSETASNATAVFFFQKGEDV